MGMKMLSKSKQHQNRESHATSTPHGEAVNPSAADSSCLEEIRIRAYETYTERGGQKGHDVEDWLQAERELGPKARSAHAGQ